MTQEQFFALYGRACIENAQLREQVAALQQKLAEAQTPDVLAQAGLTVVGFTENGEKPTNA